jgi:hypothetical protein
LRIQEFPKNQQEFPANLADPLVNLADPLADPLSGFAEGIILLGVVAVFQRQGHSDFRIL